MGRGRVGLVFGVWMVFVFFVAVFGVVLNVPVVWGSGTIYIRADGSIDPPTAPIISADNITYTFTDNISESIVIERNNIVVDGAGYTVQGAGSGTGIDLTYRVNATVKNTRVMNFTDGIRVYFSSGITLSGNTIISNSWHGIELYRSSNNILFSNNITGNGGVGIVGTEYSSSNNISSNQITKNSGGILLGSDSAGNTISINNVTSNGGVGIYLSYSSDNNLMGNVMNDNEYNFGIRGYELRYFLHFVDTSNLVNGKPIYYWVNRHEAEVPLDAGYVALVNSTKITVKNLTLKSNREGMLLAYTKNSLITGNNITNNPWGGIVLYYSLNNTIVRNNATGNKWAGVYLVGSSNNSISQNNLRYSDSGLHLVDSSGNNVSDNIITNHGSGIFLDTSAGNTIFLNKIKNNGGGIFSYASWGNTILSNNMENNRVGIDLYYYSSGNKVYHNNFINNAQQASSYKSRNTWDDGYPSGGNYWSDYTGVDLYSGSYQNETGSDGIGDAPYVIDASNQDNYPLMPKPRTWTVDDDGPADFSKIQEAINAANPGDIIYVHNGTYYENVVVNKRVSLIAENRNATIIDSQAKDNTVYVTADYVGISGFTIRNGSPFGGIMLHGARHSAIINNVVTNNWYGIYVHFSGSNIISENFILENRAGGVFLSFESEANVIDGNTVTLNWVGIEMLYDTHETYEGRNLIIGNAISNNSLCGISMGSTENNNITTNNIINNWVGIKIDRSGGNSIYHNNFINNHEQAYVSDVYSSFNNAWDDGYPSGGNYWSDYTGVDEKRGTNQDQLGRDGIGDTPYIIDTNNRDRYPLMYQWPDTNPPTTNHDYDDTWCTTDFTITLTATDERSGVAETYYKINDGPTKTVSADGQPLITTEGANNKLEYWSVDNAGNEESHHTLTEIKLDKTAPTIGVPSRTPDEDILPEQEVKVSVGVTDVVSGVKNVSLSYTTDDGLTWTNLPMNYNSSTSLYEATIPPQRAGTWVKYKMVAQDNAGNQATKDGADPFFIYQVIPEFPTWTAILATLSILSVTLTLLRRRTHPHHHNHN